MDWREPALRALQSRAGDGMAIGTEGMGAAQRVGMIDKFVTVDVGDFPAYRLPDGKVIERLWL